MRTEITPGQTSDYLDFDLIMTDNLPQPSVLLADRGYDADSIRKAMDNRNVLPVIPMRKSRKKRIGVDRSLYRLRNLVERCFDTIEHGHLRSFLDLRITDGVIRRMIDNWLKAGVPDRGTLRKSVAGAPQGGVISPLLANLFLHHVLDEWFAKVAKPRLKRRCQLIRYADDFVMSFEDHLNGRRMLVVLGKRLGRFGLTLHPDKTRYVDFRFKRPQGRHPATQATNFVFLGFTHVWGTSRRSKPVVRQITTKDCYARALHAVKDWCRKYLTCRSRPSTGT